MPLCTNWEDIKLSFIADDIAIYVQNLKEWTEKPQPLVLISDYRNSIC